MDTISCKDEATRLLRGRREIKYRVYGKRQTWICTTWPRSFTVHFNYTKIGIFTPILSIRIVLSYFYLLVSHFEDFSTWFSRLLFAANAMLNLYRDSRKSKRTFAMFRLRNRLAVATGLVYYALLLVTPIALLTIFLNPQSKGVGDKF